ncbi:supervillin-like protein [Lates japonicus]|uniref:Supervillin-like protein n=1 Tax=Lates japonicus TaxID=270547 RepID=A0AAD3N0P0_LATJO|nr:supervillin-like protein [Lates japonicus]
MSTGFFGQTSISITGWPAPFILSAYEENDREDESLTDDITDGGSFSIDRQQREGGSSSDGSSRMSFEEMRSPSPDESLDKTSSVSEDVEELESSLDGSVGSSIKQRLAEFTSGGDEKDRLKKPKTSDLIQKPLADRFSQLHEAENAWRKKKSNVDVEPKMSLVERMKILKEKEEQWKSKGKGAANDSIQFTVAGRMAKRGLVSDTGKEESPLISLKKSNATPVKPHEEISGRTDVKVEGDKRLDKLESFLDKLHNKGVSKSKTSTIEVTAETEKEVMTLDDEETFGNFYKSISPSTLQDSTVVVTEEDLSQIQANTPKLTSAVAEHKRAVRPARRNQGSRNPLRALAARNDLRQVYTEQRLNVATVETKRIQVERMAKHSNLADVALAGLASKENFRKVSLRSVKSTDVVTNNSALPFNKLMLIRIKGRRHVQVRLVEPTARSLNSGDCFLLITPKHCFMWSGEFANVIEKAKASEMASFVQAKRDLGCKAPQVTVLEEGINTESRWAKEFWSLLGGKTKYRGAGEPEEDQLYESGVLDSNGVYRLQGDKLVPHEDAWASIPSVSLLNSKEVLVFDFGSEVYVWHGKDVPLGDSKVAVKLGKQLYSGSYDYSNCRVNPLDASCSPVHLTGPPSASTDLQPGRQALLDNEPEPVKTVLREDSAGHGLVRTEDGRQAERLPAVRDTWYIKEHSERNCQESLGQPHEGDAHIRAGKLRELSQPKREDGLFFGRAGTPASKRERNLSSDDSELGSHRGSQVVGGCSPASGEEGAEALGWWKWPASTPSSSGPGQPLVPSMLRSSIPTCGTAVAHAGARQVRIAASELGLSSTSSRKVEEVEEGELSRVRGKPGPKRIHSLGRLYAQDPGKKNYTPLFR